MDQVGLRTGRFRRTDRFLDSREFRRMMRRGRRIPHRAVVVIVSPIEEKRRENGNLGMGQGSRLGIIASRKVGNAVCRNRFKRRVREWFRHRRADFEQDLDLLVIARRSGVRLSAGDLDRRLCELLALNHSMR